LLSFALAYILSRPCQSTALSIMSKKRPGVAASIKLAKSGAVNLWERVEQQYDSIRSDKLLAAENACRKLNVGEDAECRELSKDQLLALVQWKFAVGKPRPQNLGLLRANADVQVQKSSRAAIDLATEINFANSVSESTGELTTEGTKAIKETLENLTQLRGVGPATATVVLSRVRPDIFCYMYDEVIDCFEPKRDYTVNVYLRINSKCLQLAKSLGDDWTTARVAKVLWIAACVLAGGGDDLTASGATRQAVTKKTSSRSLKETPPLEGSRRKRPKTKR